MPENKIQYWLTLAGVGLFSASVTAVGNALGLTRRVKVVEESVRCIHKSKDNYVLKTDQDKARESTMVLMAERAEHHAALLKTLETTTQLGLAAIYERLNKMDAGK